MYEVELIDISHSYSSKVALDHVSIGFRKNTITALIGRSGSGKSTIIKTINGLITPQRGTVLVSGRAMPGDLAAHRRRIGYVVQGNGLFPHLDVAANVFLPERIRGNTFDGPAAERVRDMLRLVDLPASYAQRLPRALSGGEQQRVALARALLVQPPILLMDEPFGSLDPLSRKEMNELLLTLQASMPATIIIVTHDVLEARRIADDIAVIDQGKLIQHGPVADVFSNPANQLVSDLIQTTVA